MTNLTEQWKKGKLPDGFYWIEFEDGEILLTTFSSMHGFICCDSLCDDENIKQILEEMPSYEEYQKLLSDQLAKNEGAEINAELEERLKKTQKLELDLRRENRKLKELLKDCKPFVELCNYTPENKRLLEQIVEQIGDK